MAYVFSIVFFLKNIIVQRVLVSVFFNIKEKKQEAFASISVYIHPNP